METQLTQFAEAILGLTPRAVSVLLGDMPRMGGAWAGTQGATGQGGGDVLLELKRKTAAFRVAYLADNQVYHSIAQDIEGLLLVAQTLSILNDDETLQLLDQLHDLIEKGK